MGRPYVAPAGVPKDRADALRKAFMATMEDKEFLADVAKAQFEITRGVGREARKDGDGHLPRDAARGRREGDGDGAVERQRQCDVDCVASRADRKLRVGIWTVPFLRANRTAFEGLIPDLGHELARRVGVPAALERLRQSRRAGRGLRAGALDVTFVGITADRAEAIDFGPVMFELQTTYLVPAASQIGSIADIDRPGVRIAVPAPSAQQAHLKKIIAHATLCPVAPENPGAALALLAAGEADAFSHVAPMLAAAQAGFARLADSAGQLFQRADRDRYCERAAAGSCGLRARICRGREAIRLRAAGDRPRRCRRHGGCAIGICGRIFRRQPARRGDAGRIELSGHQFAAKQ